MLSLISSGSNYIFIVMCAIYALSCFTVFLPSSESAQVRRMDRQETYMFLFHFICYGVLFCKTMNYSVLILYVAQAVFFKILIYIYAHLYVDCSRILMNHMCFLLIIGFVMQTRLDIEKAVKQFIIVVVVSLIVLFIPYFMEKAYWLKKLRWVYGLLGFAFLATVFAFGVTKNGSTNWISLGPVSLQPSEFVKILFIFFVAAMLDRAPKLSTMIVTILFAASHVVVLILEKDLGGALLFFVIFVFMCYAATGRVAYLLGGTVAGAFASRLAYSLFAHVRVRFQIWKNPWADVNGDGYQICQALFAIGSGGWLGSGLTQGSPGYIPEATSDSVFAAICEEFGAIFAICLIFIYIGIFVHFLKIAMDVQGRFYKLVGYGFSACFLFQVFLNVGGIIKFIPLTGVTLPLISYGGSSVSSTLIIFAIMQGVFMIAYKEDDYDEEAEAVPDKVSEHWQ